MSDPKTLLQMAGAPLDAPALSDSVLVIIDAQNEYVSGAVPLVGMDQALGELKSLLGRVRTAGAPVIHIAHKGAPGGVFDRDANNGQIIDVVAPMGDEAVIEKALPNAFQGTDLHDQIRATGKATVIFTGFMSHMCVSSTMRVALDLGLSSAVAASACTTRDLPDGQGGVVPAAELHRAAMTALSDRFGIVVHNVGDFPD